MRRLFKWLFRAVVALAVLLPVAWVLCNGRWADARPTPVPAELQVRPVNLAPSRNAFYDVQGLAVPLTDNANAWGQANLLGDAREGELSWPKDPLWHCKPAERSCVEAWRGQRARMAEFLVATQDLGRRCDSITAAEGIEEVLPERRASGPLSEAPFVQLPLPRFAGISNCLRWFGARAVLAVTSREAQAEFEKANRLARLVLAGSRSLIGTMIGVTVLQNHWLLAAHWAASTPGVDRATLLPLLAPLPAQALSPRTWVPYEARFFRELMTDMMDLRGCNAGDDAEDAFSAERLWCRARLGLLPELSVQYNDARWLARLETLPAEGLASCEQLSLPVWRDTGVARLAWRNTLGRLMLDSPGTDWAGYAARQLDLELLRQTLRAQALGEPTPATVQLTLGGGVRRFAACRARLAPGEAGGTLRLPLF